MKKYFLLPHRFNAIGWVLIGVALLVTILDFADALPAFSSKVFSVVPDFSFGNEGFIVTNDSWYDEIEMVAGYLGLYFVAMSALKEEDELTLLLRLRSLMWAFTANAALLRLSMALRHDVSGNADLPAVHSPLPLGDPQDEGRNTQRKGGMAMKNNIRVERAIHRITQQQLAEEIGVSRQTINAIESERYTPSTLLALKLSKVFGKPVNDLFQLEDSDL